MKTKYVQIFTILLVLAFFAIPNEAFAFSLDFSGSINIEPAFKVLKNDPIGIKTIWKNLLNFVNGFVIIVLIAVAFAQILRLNINTYGVKKILPALVFAIIAANFSYLFCRLLVDIANIIMSYIMNGADGSKLTNALNGANSWASPKDPSFADLATDGSTVFWFIIFQFLLFASGVIIYILSFLFFIRLWLIYFLVAVSPLAFMSTVLPQTKKYFGDWWSNFSKWVFMPISSVFFIWLGSQWLDVAGSSWFMQIVFAGACFYMAITAPFKMGGAIMGQWSKYGKQAWGKTGGAAWKSTGGAGVNLVKTGINSRYDRQKDKLKNRFYETGVGQWVDQKASRQRYLTQLEKDVRAKSISDADKKTYYEAYQQHVKSGFTKLNKAQEGRVYAKLRGLIGEERETFANMTPDQIKNQLDSKHALNPTTGKLKTEEELALLSSDDYVQTKAIINRARQLYNSTIHRDRTKQVMETDPDAIIPAAFVNTWRSGDIARNLYGTSAVGAGVQGGAVAGSAMIDHIGKIQQLGGGKFLAAALTGGDAAAAYRDVLKSTSPAQRQEIQHSVQAVKQELNDWMKEELNDRKTALEQTLGNGFKELKGMDLSKGYDGLSHHLEEKFEEASRMTDSAMRESTQKALEHTRSALLAIKSSGTDITPDIDMDGISKKIMGDQLHQIETKVQQEAKIHVGSQIVASNMANQLAGNPATANLQVGALAESEHAIHALNENIEHLTQAVSKGSDATMSHMTSLKPSDVGEVAQFKKMLQEATSGSGAGTVADLASNSEFKESMAEAVKRGFLKAGEETKKPVARPEAK